MATGTVKDWSPRRGSGWIKPEGGGDAVYVHKSGIEGFGSGSAPRLERGQRVEYQIGQRLRGSAAINVRPLTEQPAEPPAVDVSAAPGEPAAAISADEG